MPEKQCYCYFQRFSFSQIIFVLVVAVISKEIRFMFCPDSCACPRFFVCWLVFGGGGVLHEGEKYMYYGEKTGWAREIECHVIVDG